MGVLLAWWYVLTQRYVSDPQWQLSSLSARMGTAIGLVLMVWGVIWALQANAGIYLNDKVATALYESKMDEARTLVSWQHRFVQWFIGFEVGGDMWPSTAAIGVLMSRQTPASPPLPGRQPALQRSAPRSGDDLQHQGVVLATA